MFRPDGREPGPAAAEMAPPGWRDLPAEAQGATVPPVGSAVETEPPEPDWPFWNAAESVAEPPPRRQPSGRLPRPLTVEEELRLDRRVRSAYLDRALLRHR